MILCVKIIMIDHKVIKRLRKSIRKVYINYKDVNNIKICTEKEQIYNMYIENSFNVLYNIYMR